MRSLYLLLAALITSFTASAQQRYVPATVTLVSGDSLVGEMDFRKWDVEPSAVNFRVNGAVTSYTPEMLSSFRIHENDERYLSIAGDLDITRETVEVLLNEKIRVIHPGRHFFRIMLHGPIQLLQFTDKHMRKHFAVHMQDTVLHLIREVRYIDNPESPNYGKLQTIYHFRQQLMLLTEDCDIKSRLDLLDYRVEAISKVLIKYAACKHPGVVVGAPKKDPAMRTMLGLLGGISMNTFKVTGVHHVARNNFKSSFTPIVGVFMELPLSRRRQQFSLNAELVYESRKLQSDGKLDKVDVNYHYLILQSMMRYTYPVGELRPYVNVGVGIMCNLGGKDIIQRADNNVVDDALNGGRELILPLLAGAGVRYKRFNVEARVMLPHQLENYVYLNTKATTGQLLVRYTLRQ